MGWLRIPFLILVLCLTSVAEELGPEVRRRVAAALVHVACDFERGEERGWDFLLDGGFVVTAEPLVGRDGAFERIPTSVEVRPATGGEAVAAKVVWIEPEGGLAILRPSEFPDGAPEGLSLADGPAPEGSRVWVCRPPPADAGAPDFAQGTLQPSGDDGATGPRIDAPLDSEHGGSPIVDHAGRVVAMVGMTGRPLPRSFAIGVDPIRETFRPELVAWEIGLERDGGRFDPSFLFTIREVSRQVRFLRVWMWTGPPSSAGERPTRNDDRGRSHPVHGAPGDSERFLYQTLIYRGGRCLVDPRGRPIPFGHHLYVQVEIRLPEGMVLCGTRELTSARLAEIAETSERREARISVPIPWRQERIPDRGRPESPLIVEPAVRELDWLRVKDAVVDPAGHRVYVVPDASDELTVHDPAGSYAEVGRIDLPFSADQVWADRESVVVASKQEREVRIHAADGLAHVATVRFRRHDEDRRPLRIVRRDHNGHLVVIWEINHNNVALTWIDREGTVVEYTLFPESAGQQVLELAGGRFAIQDSSYGRERYPEPELVWFTGKKGSPAYRVRKASLLSPLRESAAAAFERAGYDPRRLADATMGPLGYTPRADGILLPLLFEDGTAVTVAADLRVQDVAAIHPGLVLHRDLRNGTMVAWDRVALDGEGTEEIVLRHLGGDEGRPERMVRIGHALRWRTERFAQRLSWARPSVFVPGRDEVIHLGVDGLEPTLVTTWGPDARPEEGRGEQTVVDEDRSWRREPPPPDVVPGKPINYRLAREVRIGEATLPAVKPEFVRLDWPRAVDMVVDRDGKRVYLADAESGEIRILDAVDDYRELCRIPVDGGPDFVWLGGDWLVVGSSGTQILTIFDVATHEVVATHDLRADGKTYVPREVIYRDHEDRLLVRWGPEEGGGRDQVATWIGADGDTVGRIRLGGLHRILVLPDGCFLNQGRSGPAPEQKPFSRIRPKVNWSRGSVAFFEGDGFLYRNMERLNQRIPGLKAALENSDLPLGEIGRLDFTRTHGGKVVFSPDRTGWVIPCRPAGNRSRGFPPPVTFLTDLEATRIERVLPGMVVHLLPAQGLAITLDEVLGLDPEDRRARTHIYRVVELESGATRRVILPELSLVDRLPIERFAFFYTVRTCYVPGREELIFFAPDGSHPTVALKFGPFPPLIPQRWALSIRSNSSSARRRSLIAARVGASWATLPWSRW